MVQATTITSDEEIRQVLDLQQQNLSTTVSAEQARREGFVTVKHSFDLLKKMNEAAPQIIAKDDDLVVGYALVMPESFKEMIPVLMPMFTMLQTISYREKPIRSFYVMGQICVREGYRGHGIVDKLYAKHKELYQHQYKLCVTEVAERNQRSMKAHLRVGFQTIHTFTDVTDTWNILVWDWD